MIERSVFITGGAKGIGRASALRFAKRGYFVGIFDIDRAGAEAVANEIGADHAIAGALDVRDPESFKKAIRDFGARTNGTMSVLFNSAGILRTGKFDQIPPGESHALVQVNLLGVLNGLYAALPLLEKTKNACVVTMSSASAIYGTPEQAVYSATKFAVRALTEALDIEFRPRGIRVTDVMPSYVDTEMVSSQSFRPGTLKSRGIKLTADDVAALVVRAAEGNRVHWFASFDENVLHRVGNLVPGFGRALMRKLSRLE